MAKEDMQTDLFGFEPKLVESVNPHLYERVIVAFSGGKDSLACLLHLLELGVPKSKIELWHHAIDGNGEPFMDWPITESYCKAVAKAFDLPLYFSWRIGGFEREMCRDDAATAGVITESPDGDLLLPSKGDKLGTRLKFPQVGASLSTRWCSAYLKIDVAARAITGQERFQAGKFLMVTGERAEESSNRAKYKTLEPHKSTTRMRKVDQWRAVLGWTETQVWEIIERHGIRPHPSYLIGLSRVSCMLCIFASKNQWATVEKIAPVQFGKVAYYEKKFGVTIRRDGPVTQASNAGTPLQASSELTDLATSDDYNIPVILAASEVWKIPKGAFGEACGPT